MDISLLIHEFTKQISGNKVEGKVEIYNEAGIQFELAIFLRQKLGSSYTIQLERNIEDYTSGNPYIKEIENPEKKEMDILVFDEKESHCIELKFPTNGQYPEQMFSACKDIRFLEQLTSAGFDECYFVMFAKDKPFFEGKEKTGIYHFFRVEQKIRGNIKKPTGTKNKELRLIGTYGIEWKKIDEELQYFVVNVKH